MSHGTCSPDTEVVRRQSTSRAQSLETTLECMASLAECTQDDRAGTDGSDQQSASSRLAGVTAAPLPRAQLLNGGLIMAAVTRLPVRRENGEGGPRLIVLAVIQRGTEKDVVQGIAVVCDFPFDLGPSWQQLRRHLLYAQSGKCVFPSTSAVVQPEEVNGRELAVCTHVPVVRDDGLLEKRNLLRGPLATLFPELKLDGLLEQLARTIGIGHGPPVIRVKFDVPLGESPLRFGHRFPAFAPPHNPLLRTGGRSTAYRRGFLHIGQCVRGPLNNPRDL